MSNTKQQHHSKVIQEIESYLKLHSTSSVNYYFNNSLAYFYLFLLIILGIGFLVLPFIAQNIFPFHLLSKIANSQNVIDALGSKSDAQTFVFVIKAILFFIGILLFLIANNVWNNLKKSKIIRVANLILQQSLEQFKSIETSAEKIIFENGGVLKSLEPHDLKIE